MPEPRLYLFDDRSAQGWEPFALTRPAGELLFGTLTLRARAERALGIPCDGHIAASRLHGFAEPGAPTVLDRPPLRGARIFLSARVVLERFAWRDPGRPVRLVVEGRTVGWFTPNGAPAPELEQLLDPGETESGDAIDLPGRLLDHPWQLMAGNAEQLVRDLANAPRAVIPAHVHVLGDAAGVSGELADFEPGVVLDVRDGPIAFDRGVTVRTGTRLAGPAWVGPGTTLLGGSISGVSIGPVCRIRGEVEETVVLGYANKAHDGFLGHAYLGRWVNLGALTTNSDLKNNYGTIRMWTPAGTVDTGLIKVGCLVGDHVKTGIGVMLNTGTVIGAGANLFGAAQPPKHVPPFRWGEGADLVDYDLGRFLDTARTVMARRGIELDEGMRGVLERAWHASRDGA